MVFTNLLIMGLGPGPQMFLAGIDHLRIFGPRIEQVSAVYNTGHLTVVFERSGLVSGNKSTKNMISTWLTNILLSSAIEEVLYNFRDFIPKAALNNGAAPESGIDRQSRHVCANPCIPFMIMTTHTDFPIDRQMWVVTFRLFLNPLLSTLLNPSPTQMLTMLKCDMDCQCLGFTDASEDMYFEKPWLCNVFDTF